MSYDIHLEKSACGHCGRGGEVVFEVNVTSNVSGIVNTCLDAAGVVGEVERHGIPRLHSWWRLDGMKAKDAEPLLAKALAAASDPGNEAYLRGKEPSNGWGSLEGVRDALSGLLGAVRSEPDGRISASS